MLVSGTQEKAYFEWFKFRTATKLPGSFISGFWTTLLFQASLNEPAVSHAVLALSSVHKEGSINDDNERKIENVPDKQEKFALQHYVKAISHLQPHFFSKNRASFRVALITCVVFVCIEILRGHFKAAQTHLQNGLKILGEMQMLSIGKDGILRLKPCRESTDDWIVEIFSRLNLQVELFNHGHPHACLLLQPAGPDILVPEFRSFNEAWQHMERLLNEIFYLNHQSRQQAESECQSPRDPLALLEHQQRVRRDLVQWLDIFEAFKKKVQWPKASRDEIAYQLLCPYHSMATIMAETCLQPSDEMAYDSHTNQFVLLIKQLTNLRLLRATGLPTSPDQSLPVHCMNMSRSIIDVGWIPPLYYVAIKCRVHRIRLKAVRFLESCFHREGIWDATTAACVARKVMEIEERDFYKDVDTVDDFQLHLPPTSQDLSLPMLPESYRLSDVEVVLADAPMGKISVFCKREQEGIGCRVLLSEFNAPLQP